MTCRPKILTMEQAIEATGSARGRGETVVMCHGCFDVLHPGHERYLTEAAGLGDRLLVTVTCDAHVNKGPGRPHVDEGRRAECLAELAAVDWVMISHHTTAVESIEAIKPDRYVKGAEYAESDDPRFLAELRVVEAQGGRVSFTSDEVVFSSTKLIESMSKGNGHHDLRTRGNVCAVRPLALEF